MARREKTLALILAAGRGQRLGRATPKILIDIAGASLLERHCALLRAYGVDTIVIVGGYRYQQLAQACRNLPVDVTLIENRRFHHGSILSLHLAHDYLSHLPDDTRLLIMDGDVLYDQRLIAKLVGCDKPSCFLAEQRQDVLTDAEAVKVVVQQNRIIDFAKTITQHHNSNAIFAESVGFVALRRQAAQQLATQTTLLVTKGCLDAPHEDALQALIHQQDDTPLGVCLFQNIPWIEIDTPTDLDNARQKIYPDLYPLPTHG